MDFDTSLSHSARCLKQAIPLLVKYKIPVTPVNYAIWYCYVLGSNQDLNNELDGIIAVHGTCPATDSRVLFDKYLSESDLELFHKMSDELHLTIDTVQNDLTSTINSSQSYSDVLKSCQKGLNSIDKNKIDAFDNVLGYVDRLTQESINMQQSAQNFQTQLESAYSEITQLKQALLNTQEAAITDQLTNLYNRGKFDNDIVGHCKYQSNKPQKSLIFIDIDHFKQFNDDFGHQKGDDILKVVATKIKKHCVESSQAYRFGGEEFCILGEFNSISEALNFSQTIRKNIEKLSVKGKKTGKAVRNITASFGIAFYNGKETVEEYIARADKALYLAKAHGRNRVEIAPTI